MKFQKKSEIFRNKVLKKVEIKFQKKSKKIFF